MKGSRVQNIVNELQGEKIDIVRWNEDIDVFAKEALKPAEIQSISINNQDHTLDVIVEDDQLSLAIGRRGQNVRLAAMLTGWKVNIISKSKLQERIKLAVENLLQLTGFTESTAQVLVQSGIMSIVDLSAASPEEVARVSGRTVKDAQALIDMASAALEDESIKSDIESEEEIISASAVPQQQGLLRKGAGQGANANSTGSTGGANAAQDSGKFSDAERRLREELAAFKLK